MFILKKFDTIYYKDTIRKEGMGHIMKNKICVMDEKKICDDCGDCSRCLLDSKKKCDSCGDCLKPEFLGTRKITISNIEDAFVNEANINEMKKNVLINRFVLHDVNDLRGDYNATQKEDLVEEEISQEEEDKLNKAIEEFKEDVEVDENGVVIEHIEDIEGLSDLIGDEEINSKYMVEEFPGLLKFDKNYRNNKKEKEEKKNKEDNEE